NLPVVTFNHCHNVVTVGVVGGSDLVKISEQLGNTVTNDYDYVFSENGLVAHKDGKLIGKHSLKSYLGDEKLKEFINFTLHYIADLDIPIKRSGMLNVSPIGRNCSQEERDEFEKYDKILFLCDLKTIETIIRYRSYAKQWYQCSEKSLNILISPSPFEAKLMIWGCWSWQLFPQGWDKTYCLRYLEEFNEIQFFWRQNIRGNLLVIDVLEAFFSCSGGNDHEIYESERTVGHTVTSLEEILKQCSVLFLGKDNGSS
ncbi:hypothetical protein H5410_028460, partial [Solanum commersonii]